MKIKLYLIIKFSILNMYIVKIHRSRNDRQTKISNEKSTDPISKDNFYFENKKIPSFLAFIYSKLFQIGSIII